VNSSKVNINNNAIDNATQELILQLSCDTPDDTVVDDEPSYDHDTNADGNLTQDGEKKRVEPVNGSKIRQLAVNVVPKDKATQELSQLSWESLAQIGSQLLRDTELANDPPNDYNHVHDKNADKNSNPEPIQNGKKSREALQASENSPLNVEIITVEEAPQENISQQSCDPLEQNDQQFTDDTEVAGTDADENLNPTSPKQDGDKTQWVFNITGSQDLLEHHLGSQANSAIQAQIEAQTSTKMNGEFDPHLMQAFTVN
jgi:hypothetical protein